MLRLRRFLFAYLEPFCMRPTRSTISAEQGMVGVTSPFHLLTRPQCIAPEVERLTFRSGLHFAKEVKKLIG